MKRGNTAAASTYVGPLGELLVDTGLQTIRVQDGSTPGGMTTLATTQQLSNVIAAIEGIQGNVTANVQALLANISVSGITQIAANVGNLQANSNSLNNGVYRVVLGATGNLTLPTTGNIVNNGHAWTFGIDGNLTLPNGVQLLSGYPGYGYIADTATLAGAQVYLASTDGVSSIGVENGTPLITSSADSAWAFGQNGVLTLPYSNYLQTTDVNMTIGSQGGVTIISNAAGGSTNYNWTFGTDGSTILPGSLSVAPGVDGIVFDQDTNHSIRQVGNSLEYHEWGGTLSNGNGHKFYTHGLRDSQTLRVQIADDGTKIYAADSAWTFSANGATSMPGNVTIIGNLIVNGNTTTISASNLIISDNIVYFAAGNPANTLDIGTVGHFNNGTYQHTGLVRQATTGQWKLFSNITAEPTNTIDFTYAVYDPIQVGAITSPTIVDLYANAAVQSANITTLFSNAATQATSINTINANIGAFEIYANANASTQATSINTINANVGSFYTWANTNFGTSSYSNTNVAGYLAGNITTGNISAVNKITFADTTYQTTAYPGNTVSVKQYGAVGNGSTDDSTAINNAIASGYKSIYFPPGTYIINSSIQVYASNVNIWSDGFTTIKIANNIATGINAIKLRGSNVTLKNITIDGSLGAIPVSGDNGGISIEPNSGTVDKITLDTCTLQNFIGYGIYSFSAGTLTNLKITNSRFINFTSSAATPPGIIQLVTPNSSNITVTECTFTNITGVGVGIRSQGGLAPANNIVISNNIIWHQNYLWTSMGCEVWYGKNVTITNNVFKQSHMGVSLAGNIYYPCNLVTITSNTFDTQDAYAIEAGGTNGLTVDSNTFDNFTYGIIFYNGAKDAVVVGNAFKNAYIGSNSSANLGWGIQLNGNAAGLGYERFVISDNTFFNCSGVRADYLTTGDISDNVFETISANNISSITFTTSSSENIMISNNIFKTNVDASSSSVGFISFNGNNHVIQNNMLLSTTASQNVGPAIANYNTSALSNNVVIRNNIVKNFAYGVSASQGSPTLANIVVDNNIALNCTTEVSLTANVGRVQYPTSGYYQAVGDQDYVATAATASTIQFTVAFTINRVLTLSTLSAYRGQRFRVVKTGNDPFTLSVGGLRSLVTNTWCDVTYTGSAWVLSGFGYTSTAVQMIVSNATAATSATTGALQVTGGLGIQGNLYVAGSAGNAIITTANIWAGNVVAPTVIVNNVAFTKATNGYNNWKGNTYANVDNISASVFSNGAPAFSSITGTLNYYWSSITNLTGGRFFGNTSTGGAVTTSPTTVGTAITIGSGGDTVILTLQDQDLKRAYEVRYMQTVGVGNCAIVVERLM